MFYYKYIAVVDYVNKKKEKSGQQLFILAHVYNCNIISQINQ
jgi:hypothetical protein